MVSPPLNLGKMQEMLQIRANTILAKKQNEDNPIQKR
jgi:hypothetical protein